MALTALYIVRLMRLSSQEKRDMYTAELTDAINTSRRAAGIVMSISVTRTDALIRKRAEATIARRINRRRPRIPDRQEGTAAIPDIPQDRAGNMIPMACMITT